MSNPTIELGGGKWATKPASLLAYNNHPEWGYSAKEFTVDRNSTATCVGSDGLIKTVQANEARIDYSNDPNGALLVEPQRTNYILDSNRYFAAFTPNYAVSPDGNMDASLLQPDLDSGYDSIRTTITGGTANKTLTFSIWVKTPDQTSVNFQLKNTHRGVIDNFSNVYQATNEWIRYSFTVTNNSNAGSGEQIAAIYNATGDLLLWGAQLEEASTASSYIPTNGTTVTRLNEIIEQPNVSNILNNSEGGVFWEINNVKEGNYLKIYDDLNGTSTYLDIVVGTNANVKAVLNTGLETKLIQKNTTFPVKIYCQWKEGEMALFLNGVKYSEGLTSLPEQGDLNFLRFAKASTYGMGISYTKTFKMYNTVFTDQELIDLTTI